MPDGGFSIHPEDLAEPILHDEDIVQLEEPYEVPIRIRCCIKSCRTLHNRGWIVLLRNQKYSRVGYDCARRFLGSETFTSMQRDFDKRRQRLIRQRYISSPTFDPEAAIDRLRSWWTRVNELEVFYSTLSIRFPDLMRRTRIASERLDRRFSFWDHFRNKEIEINLKGTAFLSPGWQGSLTRANAKLYDVARTLRRAELSDAEMETVIRKVTDAQDSLRSLCNIVDDFNSFCEPHFRRLMADLFDPIKIPRIAAPLDRSPIELLTRR